METEKVTKAPQVKMLIIGDQAVGKSSLLMRFIDDKFSLSMMGTAGVDMKKKVIDYNNNKINFLFYDSAGHIRFRHVTKQFYQGSKGIILAYDLTDKSTFNNVDEWIKSIKENADSTAEMVIIGNKTDLKEERVVSEEDSKALHNKYGIEVFEVSAKTGENVGNAFTKLIDKIMTNPVLSKDLILSDKKIEAPIQIKNEEKEKPKPKKACLCG